MALLTRLTLLDAIDLALILAGATVLLLGALRCGRHFPPRDPLRGAPIRLNTLSATWVWLALLAYAAAVLAANALSRLYVPAGSTGDELALQQSILAGSLMQVLVILAVMWILGQTFVAGWRGVGLGRRPIGVDLRDAIKGFLVAFSLGTVIAWLTETLLRLFDFALPIHGVFEALNQPTTPRFIDFVAVGGAFILAPIGEELLFRGVLQTAMHRIVPPLAGSLRHRWIAILATSLLFGLMHWPLVQHIPALTVLAVVLGYQYERSGSLVVPIFVHLLFNGKSLLWYALQPMP